MGMFDAPIPGQSLTDEPKNVPWERPPEMADTNDVIEYYMNILSKEEMIDNIVTMLEIDIPVDVLVNTITTTGILEGRYNPDVKLLISPLLVDFITAIGNAAGVDVKNRSKENSMSSKASISSNADKLRREKLIDSINIDVKENRDDAGTELMRQTASILQDSTSDKEEIKEDMPIEENIEETPTTEEPKSLMSRRGTM